MAEATQSGLTDSAAGSIAYLTLIPAIVFLIVEPYNKNPYVRFHSWQSIFLCVAAFVINVILTFVFAFAFVFMPFLHLLFWPLVQLCWLAVWLICVVNAYNGKMFKLPLIGSLAEQQAGK